MTKHTGSLDEQIRQGIGVARVTRIDTLGDLADNRYVPVAPMRLVLWSLLLLVVSVAVLKAAVVYIEPALAFFPEKGTQETPRSAGRHFETVHIPTADGETLQAWLMPVEQPRAQVIFWHGNGGNLSVWLPAYLDFADLNASLLAFDYGGTATARDLRPKRGSIAILTPSFRSSGAAGTSRAFPSSIGAVRSAPASLPMPRRYALPMRSCSNRRFPT